MEKLEHSYNTYMEWNKYFCSFYHILFFWSFIFFLSMQDSKINARYKLPLWGSFPKLAHAYGPPTAIITKQQSRGPVLLLFIVIMFFRVCKC